MKRFFKTASILLIACLGFAVTSCSDEEEPVAGEVVAGEYLGKVISNLPESNEAYYNQTIRLTANNDGTVNLVYETEDLISISLNNLTVTGNSGTYRISGSGRTDVINSYGSLSSDFSLSAEIVSLTSATFVFDINYKGGRTVTFTTHEEVDLETAAYLTGSYSGIALRTIAEKKTYSLKENFRLAANPDGTVNFIYESKRFGDHSVENIRIRKENNGYILESSDYETTFSGTISSDKSSAIFTLTTNTGTTIAFDTSTNSITKAISKTYTGRLRYTLSEIVGFDYLNYMFDGITSNDDGTINFKFEDLDKNNKGLRLSIDNQDLTITYATNTVSFEGSGTTMIDIAIKNSENEYETLERKYTIKVSFDLNGYMNLKIVVDIEREMAGINMEYHYQFSDDPNAFGNLA